jgi:hydrogenase maturation protease
VTSQPYLVVGLGNELLSDEAVGIAASRKLADTTGAAEVEILDGGTLGLALAPALGGRQGVILLDALRDPEHAPGTVLVLEGEDVPRSRHLSLSVHQIGPAEMLAAAELAGDAPKRLALIGAVPATLAVGVGLSPALEAAATEMATRAREILERWEAARDA